MMSVQKGNILIPFLLGALLVALLTAGYFFYSAFVKTPADKPTQEQSSNTNSPTPIPTVTQDETANWKTYHFLSQNLVFKYPDNWYLKELGKSTIIISPDLINIPYAGDAILKPILIGINECNNTTNGNKFPCETSVDQRVTILKRDITPNTYKESTKSYGGKIFKIISGVYGPSPMEGESIKELIAPGKNNYLLIATLIGKEQGLTFDQILSTFKFTE